MVQSLVELTVYPMAPLQRFYKLPQDKQNRILDVAAEDFATHGYKGASLNRIIKAAGVSKGAMYYYFEDKADLFVSVFRGFDEKFQGLFAIDPDGLTVDNFWGTLSDMGDKALAFSKENPVWLGVGKAFYEIPQDDWFEGTIGVYLRERLGRLHAIIAAGQDLGVVRDDLPIDLLIKLWMGARTVLSEWVLEQWDDLSEGERKEIWSTMLELLRRLLEPRTQGPAQK